jgi:hypothetical protein
MNNYQRFTRYFADTICLDRPLPDSSQFLLLWISLFRMPLRMHSESSLVPNADNVTDGLEDEIPSPSKLSSVADRMAPYYHWPLRSADKDAAIANVTPQKSISFPEPWVDDPDENKSVHDCLAHDYDYVISQENSPTWEFRESQHRETNVIRTLDILVLPFIQNWERQSSGVNKGIVILMFDYFTDEFILIAWLKAMKQFANLLGLSNYSPDCLIGRSKDALAVWEDNAENQPGNPVVISRLAEAYATLGDIDVEIAGWWRLLERHPGRLSFLSLLYRAWIRKTSEEPNLTSFLSFWRLCILFYLSRKAETAGIGYLYWWPLAGEEELMLFRSHVENRSCRNVILLSH